MELKHIVALKWAGYIQRSMASADVACVPWLLVNPPESHGLASGFHTSLALMIIRCLGTPAELRSHRRGHHGLMPAGSQLRKTSLWQDAQEREFPGAYW